jgi:sodium-coupled neutral amino acid transporter 11
MSRTSSTNIIPSLNTAHINENYYSSPTTTSTNSHSRLTLSARNRRKERQERAWNDYVGVKTGVFFSIWNLVNDILSPGTVGMAQYVAQSGLIISLILFVFFSIITTYTLVIVYDLAKKWRKKSLPDLCEQGFGKVGYQITCLFIVLFNFGGVCAQFLMFGEVVPELLLYIYGEPHILISRTAVLIYLTIFLLPIACLKDLGSFAIISFISVASVLAITVIVFYKALLGRAFNPPLPDDWKFIHPEALSALGGFSYLFVCHDLSFNVFGGLRKSTRPRYYTVVFVTMILTVLCVGTMGLSGYFLFFDLNLKEANVLQLLPRSDILAIVGRFLLTLDIALAIPYTAFMPRYGLNYMVTAVFPSIRTDKVKAEVFHFASTFFFVFLGLGIALLFTDLGVVFEITGGVSACSLAYIIPPLLMLKLEKGWFTFHKIASAIVLLLGLGIFGCSLGSIIYKLVKQKDV